LSPPVVEQMEEEGDEADVGTDADTEANVGMEAEAEVNVDAEVADDVSSILGILAAV